MAVTAQVVEASYSRPYIAHAAMAPSCALAEYRNGHLSVWSHTQGVYPLRAAIANVLGIAPECIKYPNGQLRVRRSALDTWLAARVEMRPAS